MSVVNLNIEHNKCVQLEISHFRLASSMGTIKIDKNCEMHIIPKTPNKKKLQINRLCKYVNEYFLQKTGKNRGPAELFTMSSAFVNNVSKFTLDRWAFSCYIIPDERQMQM